MKEAVVALVIMALAKINFVIWYYYTRNRVTHKYHSPKHEWDVNTMSVSWTDKIIWPIFDILSTTRKRRLIWHGSFNDPETGLYMGAWYDTVNRTFSLKMGKRYHHGYTEEEAIERVRYMFSDNTRIKKAWIELIAAMVDNNPPNLNRNIISSHV